jgi:hypothetical protein
MKLPIILFSAFFLAALFDVGLAVSKTTSPRQPANATHRQAMDECTERHGGFRGHLSRDRYAFIEPCFKEKTGMYPFQARVNCVLHFRNRDTFC